MALSMSRSGRMRDLVFYADLTNDRNVGGWAEATFKVAGVYKASNDVCSIRTTSGATVTIRRAAQSGTLTMDGETYPISNTCTGSCSVTGSSRRLATDDVPATPVEFSGPRRRLGFFSALQTSGSFTMMQAGGF